MRYSIPTCLMIVLLTASLTAQTVESHQSTDYRKDHWGFALTLPPSWKVHREADVPEQFLASFGMPKIWSQQEKANIENAVSISVLSSKTVKSLADVVRHEEARIADILLEKKEVKCEDGIAFDARTRINRLEYVSRSVCRHLNGLGYTISFTGTDGTFAQNLPAFEKLVDDISFSQPSDLPQHLADRNHYELALEHYKFGPSHAQKIITELKEHLAVDKDDDKAMMLLGITQKGIGLYDDALRSFEKADQLIRADKRINHRIAMHQAQCYYQKSEFRKAHDVLRPMSGFFLSDPRQEMEYDALMKSITDQIGKSDQ